MQNTCIIGIPEEEARVKGKELSETLITENFPQIDGRHQSQSQEAWETLNRIHANKTEQTEKLYTLGIYYLRTTGNQKFLKILKEAREIKNTYRRTC